MPRIIASTPRALKGFTRMPQPQSLKNHVRTDFAHHPAIVILALNVVVAIVWAFLSHSPALPLRMWVVVVSLALAVSSVKARMNPIAVQDRIIRLEEQLRFRALLSPAGFAASQNLPLSSVVALRFASDAELPVLVDRAASENLTGKQIKALINHWRPDIRRV